MARLDKDRQLRLEPARINDAVTKITNLGLEITFRDKTKIIFTYKGNPITFFPYSGWHTGKGITDGRGAENLYKQLEAGIEMSDRIKRMELISKAAFVGFDELIFLKHVILQRQEVARRIPSADGKDFEILNEQFDYINNKIKDFLAL